MRYTYKYVEELEGIDYPDFSDYNENIIMFGAGINGALCAYALQERDVDFLCFCDNDRSKQGSEYIGHPVYSPAECSRRYPQAAVLFDAYETSTSLKELKALGYETILFPATLFLDMDCEKAAAYVTEKLGHGDEGYMFRDAVDAEQVFEWIDEYMVRGARYVNHRQETAGAINLRAMNLDLTDRCTLRCKNCLAMKPYFAERKDMPWELMERQIDRLTSLKWFRRYHVLGGEPFLYENLDKVLEKLCAAPEVEIINVITNATVVPDTRLMEQLQNPKVVIRVSYYGDLSREYQSLVEFCQKNGIKVRVQAQRWLDVGRALDVASNSQETQKRYSECCQRHGAFFYTQNGKVTCCPFASNMYAMGMYESDGEDVIDLLAPLSREELFGKLSALYWREKPLTACRYCNGWTAYATRPVPVAEQYAPGEQPVLPAYIANEK